MIEQLQELQGKLALAEKRNEVRAAIELVAQIEQAKRQYAVICNLTEHSHYLNRTYRPYTIAGKEAGAAYALTLIEGRKGFEATEREGDRVISKVEFDYSAREIAEDLAHEINGHAGPNSNNGVFVCAGFEPSEEELGAARARVEEHYKAIVAEADADWDSHHKPEMISGHARDAARWLGLERAWMYTIKREQRAECAYCGSALPRADVAVCATCGAILQREKAEQGGLIAAEPPKGSGQPEPEMAPMGASGQAAAAPAAVPKGKGKGKA